MKRCELATRLRRVVEKYAASNAGQSLHIDHSSPYFRRSGIPHTEFARRATLAAKHADPQYQDQNLPRAFVYGAFLKYRDIYDHRLTPNEFKHLLAEVHKGGHIDLSRAIATGRVDPASLYDSQVNIGPRDSYREFHFVGHPRNAPVWAFRPAKRETYEADPCGDGGQQQGFHEDNKCHSLGKQGARKKYETSEPHSVGGQPTPDSVLDAVHELRTEKYPHTKLIPVSEIANFVGGSPQDTSKIIKELVKSGDAKVTFGKDDELYIDSEGMAPRQAKPREVDAKKISVHMVKAIDAMASNYPGNMVPIPDVRETIRKSLGDESARHDVLDKIIKDMVRSGHFRISPLNDATGLSPTQMNAGIPGTQETWYYLEKR